MTRERNMAQREMQDGKKSQKERKAEKKLQLYDKIYHASKVGSDGNAPTYEKRLPCAPDLSNCCSIRW